MALTPLSAGFQSLPLLRTIKLGPSAAASWVCGCVCSRTLWVSPVNSPVRLGVSPAATSTPMGVFNQRFEALFPQAGALGCRVCFTPPLFLPVYLCANVGPQCLPAATLPWVLSAPAACLHPSYRSGWMFLLYLLRCQTSIQFNFLLVLVVFCF